MPSRVVHTNLIDSDTVITSNTEDADWPHENLFDKIAAKRFRWTAVGSNWVQFDFGSSQTPDTLAIINHDGSAATVTIKGDNSDPPTTVLASPSHRDDSIWADLGNSVSARYIRIETTGIGAIGQIVIGSGVELPRAHRYGKTPGRERADIYHETQGGVAYVSHLFTREIREYQWRILESELTNFAAIDAIVKGRTLPYVWIVDTSATEVLYVRNIDMNYRPREMAEPLSDPLYDLAWSVRQESHGLELSS